MFNMSQSRYPYARELMETYQQKLSLNLHNTKKDAEQEEDEEVIVDTDVNMVGIYENQRESSNETSNVPEDLSKNSRKRNCSSEDPNRFPCPYDHEKKIRADSPNPITSSPKQEETRQSPTPEDDMS